MGWEEFTGTFWIYNGLSLCTIAIFYKVIVNTELVNTEPLLLGEIQSWLPASS